MLVYIGSVALGVSCRVLIRATFRSFKMNKMNLYMVRISNNDKIEEIIPIIKVH